MILRRFLCRREAAGAGLSREPGADFLCDGTLQRSITADGIPVSRRDDEALIGLARTGRPIPRRLVAIRSAIQRDIGHAALDDRLPLDQRLWRHLKCPILLAH